jgi:hypothetical protein
MIRLGALNISGTRRFCAVVSFAQVGIRYQGEENLMGDSESPLPL